MDLVDGSVPAEQLEQCVEDLRRDSWHPGRLFRESCLYNASLTVGEAARRLDIEPAELEPVLQGRARLPPSLLCVSSARAGPAPTSGRGSRLPTIWLRLGESSRAMAAACRRRVTLLAVPPKGRRPRWRAVLADGPYERAQVPTLVDKNC